MRLCINPNCSPKEWENLDTATNCENCGGKLEIDRIYTVTRLLNKNGGFGTIYELADAGKQPKVLKVLKLELNEQPKVLSLFQQEAHLLQQLDSPNLPKIDGYIQHELPDGRKLQGIVMEKIAGSNLLQWLHHQGNRPISQKIAIPWLRELVTALNLVHQKKYFHRDIKPSNIMLDPAGRLVLIDFGVARYESNTYLDKIYGNVGITQVASYCYSPPEQERGFAVPQSDFYALGMTFIHLVTGKYPLEMHDSQSNTYLWRNFAPHITPAFADFLDYLTSIPPIERPIDCAEILDCLNQIESPTPDVPISPTKPALCLNWIAISIGMAIVSSIGYAIAAYYQLVPSPLPKTAPAADRTSIECPQDPIVASCQAK